MKILILKPKSPNHSRYFESKVKRSPKEVFSFLVRVGWLLENRTPSHRPEFTFIRTRRLMDLSGWSRWCPSTSWNLRITRWTIMDTWVHLRSSTESHSLLGLALKAWSSVRPRSCHCSSCRIRWNLVREFFDNFLEAMGRGGRERVEVFSQNRIH